MRIFSILILLFSLLVAPLWSHEGHDHGDLRDTQETTVTGPSQSFELPLQAQGNHYTARWTQVPAQPKLGQTVQIEFSITQQLDPPDPLLGAEITLEDLEVGVKLNDHDLDPASVQGKPGTYVVRFVAEPAGKAQLAFSAPQKGLTFQHTTQIGRPLRQNLALAVTAGLMLVALAISLRRRSLVPLGFSLLLSGIALAVGFWPAAVPSPLATPTATPQLAGITIPLDLQRDLDLQIGQVRRREVERSLSVPGQIRAADGASHTLHARFPSRIISAVPQVGQSVRRGQELLVLEEVLSSADRASLRSQTVELKSRQLEFATRQLEIRRQVAELQSRRQIAASERSQRQLESARAEELYAIQVIALKDLQASRSALKQAQQSVMGLERQIAIMQKAPTSPQLPEVVGLQQYAIAAPSAGVVAQVEAAQDEVVEPTKALLKIVDLSTVWVSARVSEADLGMVRKWGRARIQVPAYSESFAGRYLSTAPTLDPETRTAQVFFAVENLQGKLLSGMSATVQLLGAREQILTVPSQSVSTHDGQSRLFVQVSPDLFEARNVRVLRQLGNDSVLESGSLAEGTKIVVSGVGALTSELARRGERK